MKSAEHVEYLLRQGRKPRELVELGFPKRVITRVRRQLKQEKIASQPETERDKPDQVAEVHAKPGLLEGRIEHLEARIEELGALEVKLEKKLEGMETSIRGTPALGLRHHFQCDCGASGFVAVHVQCTKCGKETWWGWFPER